MLLVLLSTLIIDVLATSLVAGSALYVVVEILRKMIFVLEDANDVFER